MISNTFTSRENDEEFQGIHEEETVLVPVNSDESSRYCLFYLHNLSQYWFSETDENINPNVNQLRDDA